MTKFFATAAACALCLTTGAALADGDALCNVPEAEWQTMDILQERLEADYGWEIKNMKLDKGCFEAYAHDDSGRRVEAYFNPKTFAPVKVELED